MHRCMKSAQFTLVLILVLLATALPAARVTAYVPAVQRETLPTIRPQTIASKILYLPVARTPFGPPAFAIISPGSGWTISGMTYFAVQSLDPAAISSVTFKAGATALGSDTTAQDGFKAFLNASSFPAGALTLTATASGPGGQTTQTISVNVVPNPPASGTIGVPGGVLASQIGSVITIPPGAVPNGTNVSVNEQTQAQTTAATGIDWDALGVTFLGAQNIQSPAAFAQPLGVASAGFGNRVQPGQAVVNYRILPDADGDGVGELVAVNTASVAPNNDVISDPVPQILLGPVTATAGTQSVAPSAAQAGISGKPGTTIMIRATGFNPASAFGNVAVFRSLVDNQVIEVPGIVSVDPINAASQIFEVLIPPLAPGAATVTLKNRSTGSIVAPIALTVQASSPLSAPPGEIIDAFLRRSATFFSTLPTPPPAAAPYRDQIVGKIATLRSLFQQLAGNPDPQVQQTLTETAAVVAESGILAQLPPQGLVIQVLTPEAKRAAELIALVGGAIVTFLAFVPACALAAAVIFTLIVVSSFLIWQMDGLPPVTPAATNAGAGTPGMGSVPPPGGNGGGNTAGPPPVIVMSSVRTQASAFDQPPGRFVIKVFSRGLRIPFTGLTDAGGYFFIPLIPADDAFTAVAIDTLTGKRRTFQGIGPAVGKSVLMLFDFFSDDPANGVQPIHWTGAGDGQNWDDPFNWDAKNTPQEFNDVFIDMPGTITVTHRQSNDSISALHSNENLVLSGGTLAISTTSQITGTFTLSGGTLGGSGNLSATTFNWIGGALSGTGTTTIPAGGTLSISGSTTKSFVQRRLVNGGNATWSGTGSLFLADKALLDNLAGATFDIQTDQPIDSGGSGSTIRNAGIWRKSAGTGTTTIQSNFDNNGTVDVQSGTLRLFGNGHSGGAFSSAAGATLEVGFTTVFSPTSSITGAGVVAFSGPLMTTISGSYNVTGETRVSGGRNIFNGTVSSLGSALTITGGSAEFNTAAPMSVPLLTLSGSGFLDGSGNLSATTFNWSGGGLSGLGTTTIPAGGTLTISGPSTKNFAQRTLVNGGTATWSGTGEVQVSSGARIDNLAGATFDIQTDQSMIYYGGPLPTIRNAGTWRKSATSGSSRIDSVFDNSGMVAVQTGTLSLLGGGHSDGTFSGLAGTMLEFGGGNITAVLSPTANLTSAGVVVFSSTQARVSSSYNVTGETRVNTGRTIFDGTITSLGSALTINGGSAEFNTAAPVSVTLLTMSGGNLAGSANRTATIFNWNGGVLSGPGTTSIPAGGTLTISGPDFKLIDLGTLSNAGNATWSGTGQLVLSNSALFDNLAGATFDIQTDQAINNLGGGLNIRNAGTWRKSAGSGTTAITVDFTNNGTVDVQSGTMTFSTLVNNGQISLGATARTLAIAFDYTQSATGALNIKIGGLSAGTQFDQVTIGGSATLDGTLNINLIGGFTPTTGNSFQVLNYGSRSGAFATINGNGQTYAPSYGASNLTLAVP